jgi:hypothetical protein
MIPIETSSLVTASVDGSSCVFMECAPFTVRGSRLENPTTDRTGGPPRKEPGVARVSAHDHDLNGSLWPVRPIDSREARERERHYEEADPAQMTTIPIGGVGSK